MRHRKIRPKEAEDWLYDTMDQTVKILGRISAKARAERAKPGDWVLKRQDGSNYKAPAVDHDANRTGGMPPFDEPPLVC